MVRFQKVIIDGCQLVACVSVEGGLAGLDLDGLPDLSLPELFLSADDLYIVHGDTVVMLVNMFTDSSEGSLARGF